MVPRSLVARSGALSLAAVVAMAIGWAGLASFHAWAGTPKPLLWAAVAGHLLLLFVLVGVALGPRGGNTPYRSVFEHPIVTNGGFWFVAGGVPAWTIGGMAGHLEHAVALWAFVFPFAFLGASMVPPLAPWLDRPGRSMRPVVSPYALGCAVLLDLLERFPHLHRSPFRPPVGTERPWRFRVWVDAYGTPVSGKLEGALDCIMGMGDNTAMVEAYQGMQDIVARASHTRCATDLAFSEGGIFLEAPMPPLPLPDASAHTRMAFLDMLRTEARKALLAPAPQTP